MLSLVQARDFASSLAQSRFVSYAFLVSVQVAEGFELDSLKRSLNSLQMLNDIVVGLLLAKSFFNWSK